MANKIIKNTNGKPEVAHRKPSRTNSDDAHAPELTVCSIIGDWGAYQWSICLFATLYSALASQVVVYGPILTPDIGHICRPTEALGNQSISASDAGEALHVLLQQQQDIKQQHECFKIIAAGEDNEHLQPSLRLECASFLYDDQQTGAMLTNSFDLVCDRQWLRSLVSSASLAGMLISSVTLGLFSDKFGRLRCIQIGFILSCSANALAIITQNYYIFCLCILIMSYAQVGAANALCTLLMEATSPRFRFIPVFEYGIGWGLGVMLVPGINYLTQDYRLYMAILLVWQLAMAPWLHWGIFESIRWLLSEGHFNRAQIELRRACKMNRVQTAGGQLVQDIARIQVQQVRKASRIIETNMAPVHLARALGARVDETARELDLLSDAIHARVFNNDVTSGLPENNNREFDTIDEVQFSFSNTTTPRPSVGVAVLNGNHQHLRATTTTDSALSTAAALSPTLSRMSFCVTSTSGQQQPYVAPINCHHNKQLEALMRGSNSGDGDDDDDQKNQRRTSFTTQGLIQLALKYSKTVKRHDEGQFFLIQMFHQKLWRNTTILLLISVMYETSYYGLIQASKFVGKSVELNFVLGGAGEWVAAVVSMLALAYMSRKRSLITTTLLGALICFAMAASYQLIPDTYEIGSLPVNGNNTIINAITQQPQVTTLDSLIDNEANLEPLSSLKLLKELSEGFNSDPVATEKKLQKQQQKQLIELRHQINMYLMNAGKLIICVGIQVAATIAMEAYPNNLRQTGSGAIVFVGRIGSILAPFLFNDSSQDKHILKLTLVVMAAIGLVVCLFIPFTITDNKDKELCDQMDEIGETDDEKQQQK